MAFLQQAIVYLVAAVVAVPIAKRLGLGSVLGYLIAGMLIGPVLGVVGAETEDIKHFAEFGVVMMLFLVGLELKPSLLWEMKGQLIGLGGLQVTATAAMVWGIAFFFTGDWRVSLAIGLVLCLSSTAIVLQTLNEKGWTKTPAGRSAFSVLLCQDIAVIPMLALLPLLASGHTTAGDHGHANPLATLPGYQQALIILAVIGAIIIGGHYLFRPIFRFIASARLREVFTAASLLVVVAVALAMHAIGLSPALGTFLAGVVLSGSEYRHELEADIEPFKGLLLGLFFISVGAGIDFALLSAAPGTLVGLTAMLIAGKMLILMFLARVFRLKGGDFWLFVLSLAQAGEFAFVLLAFADQGAIIDSAYTPTLSLVVTLSMLITPALFLLYEKLIMPRMSERDDRPADDITHKGTVILAGIGRFGQVLSRILTTNGYQSVVLDHDARIIDTIRKVGYECFYGDATRPDLLESAGIEDAILFVAALDDRERQTQLVQHVAHNYPDCRIVARAFDRHHYYDLENAGAHHVVRELFEGSLEASRCALTALGMHPYLAQRKIRAFRKHDVDVLGKMKSVWEANETKNYLDQVRVHADELHNVMHAEAEQRHDTTSRGWTPPPKGDAELHT